MKVQLRPIPASNQWIVRFRHPEAGPTVEVWPDHDSANERAHFLEGIPYTRKSTQRTPALPSLRADDTIRKALDLLDVGAVSTAREVLADYLLSMVKRSNTELPTPF